MTFNEENHELELNWVGNDEGYFSKVEILLNKSSIYNWTRKEDLKVIFDQFGSFYFELTVSTQRIDESTNLIVSSNEFIWTYQTPLIGINQSTIMVDLISNQQFQISWSPLLTPRNHSDATNATIIKVRVNESEIIEQKVFKQKN